MNNRSTRKRPPGLKACPVQVFAGHLRRFLLRECFRCPCQHPPQPCSPSARKHVLHQPNNERHLQLRQHLVPRSTTFSLGVHSATGHYYLHKALQTPSSVTESSRKAPGSWAPPSLPRVSSPVCLSPAHSFALSHGRPALLRFGQLTPCSGNAAYCLALART